MTNGAGYYKHRVMWMQNSQTPSGDGSGAVVDTWADQQYLWAAIEEPKGADKIMWGAMQTSVNAIIRIRGNMGVTSQDRLRTPAGEVYIIAGVSLDSRCNDQICVCSSVSEAASG